MMTDKRDQIRTFTAPSLREALAQVRNELGPDALIMDQQQMGSRIAVRACLEAQQEPQVVMQQPDDKTLQPGPLEDLVVAESSVATTGHDQPFNAFLEAGYDESVITDFPGCTDVQQLRRAVANRINYAHKSIAGLRGFYRFVGASGVGKSTTLIKVLVEWVLRNGGRDVVVVSTDNERLAGTEALQLTCQMLSVPMRECGATELPAVLGRLRSKSLVLVDSPALEQKRSVTSIASLHDIWVCSALHSPANLTAQYAAVQNLRPVGVVPTQLDQVMASDEIANLLYRWRLPLYWLGTGSRLPDDIDLADEESLFKNLFGTGLKARLELAV